MKTKAISTGSKALSAVAADLLLVGCFQGEADSQSSTLAPHAVSAVNLLTAGAVSRQASAEEFKGAVGDTMVSFTDGKLSAARIMLFGLGERGKSDLTSFKKAITAALKRARALKAKHVAFAPIEVAACGGDANAIAEAIASHAGMIDYEINHQKTEKGGYKPESHFAKLHLVVDAADLKATASGLKSGFQIAAAVNMARDLANEPAADCTPHRLAKLAEKIAAGSGGLIVTKVLNRKALTKLGANALLAVSRGSNQEPFLIDMLYTPEGVENPPELTIIGKSVTFDSGGLDIKPADGMRNMKRDMSGGAVTMATIKAIAELGLPIRVRAVMAATENMTGAKAYKPGDVLHTLAGLTVEVDNTDAEGRLTLAEAIEYAKRHGATRIVDLATLTGAVRSMVADIACGAFGNNDQFTALVVDSGAAQAERMLNVPMWAEYNDFNKSDMADLKNSGGNPGATTAAWFLRRFAGEELPWVHLDIASVAFRDREYGVDPKGATGYGVRTLIELARRLSK